MNESFIKTSRTCVKSQADPGLDLYRRPWFRSSEVRRLLLDLDPYSGTDPLGICFLFYLRELLMLLHPVLVQCFGGLFVCVVSGLAGVQANVTPIPKGLPSSSVVNYQPICSTCSQK